MDSETIEINNGAFTWRPKIMRYCSTDHVLVAAVPPSSQTCRLPSLTAWASFAKTIVVSICGEAADDVFEVSLGFVRVDMDRYQRLPISTSEFLLVPLT